MDVAWPAEMTGDMLTVRRVFGEAYERDGLTAILLVRLIIKKRAM